MLHRTERGLELERLERRRVGGVAAAANCLFPGILESDRAGQLDIFHDVFGPVVASGAVARFALHTGQIVLNRGGMAGGATRITLLPRAKAAKCPRVWCRAPVGIFARMTGLTASSAEETAGPRGHTETPTDKHPDDSEQSDTHRRGYTTWPSEFEAAVGDRPSRSGSQKRCP